LDALLYPLRIGVDSPPVKYYFGKLGAVTMKISALCGLHRKIKKLG
jgi:hypothetical protein